MYYTIKQVSERTQLSPSTLRYYDKQGLMPLLKRTEHGIRQYSETDLNWLELVCCLKNSGMQLDEIKQFMLLCLQGSSTSEQRKEILEQHKANILMKTEMLNRSLGIINYKLDHYNEIGIFHIDGQ
jgi:DNA-binding transcriptional MerR regulator